jgi:hypothetical protein
MLITILNVLVGVSLFAVVAVLLTGVAAMAVGGEFNRKYSNKLMQLRVITQGTALAMLALRVFLPGWLA